MGTMILKTSGCSHVASTCGAVNKTTIITCQAWFATSVITSMVEVILSELFMTTFASDAAFLTAEQVTSVVEEIGDVLRQGSRTLSFGHDHNR